MRDIRADLVERLRKIAADREELQRLITELDHIEAGIKALLQRESELFTTTSNGSGDMGNTDLARFVLQTLRQAKKPLSVEDFKEAAETVKMDFGEKSPGRVIHWALVGMAQGGSVEKVNDKWQIKEGTL